MRSQGSVRPWYRVWFLAALVALLAIAAIACDDDEEDDVNGDETPAVTTPTDGTPTDRDTTGALKIGILVPFTGDLSDFGPAFFNSAQLAVNEINEAGGVNGQPVELVRGDSGTAPQQAVEEARRLIEIEGVHAIIGAAASGVTLQVAESVTGPGSILQISPSATSPALTEANDNDFLFRTTISDAAQGVVLADLASEQGYSSVCTIFVNNAYGQGLSESFQEAYEEIDGEVPAAIPHEEQQASYASELGQCPSGTEAIAAISYPESAGVYLREAVEQQVTPNYLFVDGTKSGEMFEQLGWDQFEGMWGTAPGALDTAVGDAFDEAYSEAYGQTPALPFLRESYDAAYLIAAAAQAAGSNDSTAMRDALRDIANPPGTTINPGPDGWRSLLDALENGDEVNYEGAASPADFDENGDVLSGAIEIWQIQDGAIVVQETREIDLTENGE